MAAQQTVDRGTMARGDFIVGPFGLGIPPFRQASAVEELAGHSLKCGNDDNRRAAVRRLQDDSPDLPDPLGCAERRAAELEHSQIAEPGKLRRSFDARTAPNRHHRFLRDDSHAGQPDVAMNRRRHPY